MVAPMFYLSGCVVNQRHPRLGFMMTPDMGNKIPTDDVLLAADNSCFSNPGGYSDERYFAFLQKMPRDRTLFATAPDILGDHKGTVIRSTPILRRLRFNGFKAAFVAQDGWEAETTPWDELDVLFVGGSTAFKFRAGRAAMRCARLLGKWVHMGRVNSLDRLRASIGNGCNSADGTFLKFGPDKNWPRLKYWLDHITEQTGLAV